MEKETIIKALEWIYERTYDSKGYDYAKEDSEDLIKKIKENNDFDCVREMSFTLIDVIHTLGELKRTLQNTTFYEKLKY